MDEELKIGILEKNGNGQDNSNKIVNKNTQVKTGGKHCMHTAD